MSLSRLLYVSRCAIEDDAARDAHIREIAARAAARNAAAQLTGSLLHIDGTFVQVLEGPVGAVERTFESICCDFRHEDVKLVDLVMVKERVFPKWNMALLGGDTETTLPLRADLEEIRFLVGVNAREAVRQMRRVLEGEPVS